MTLLYAVAVFVVFGGVAVVMGRIAVKDWRQSWHDDMDSRTFTLVNHSQQWVAIALAALIAVIGPVVIVVNG